MHPPMVVVQATLDMRAWVRRRRDKGEEPNADDVWSKIRKDHPKFTAEDKEYVFNYCDVRPKKRRA